MALVVKDRVQETTTTTGTGTYTLAGAVQGFQSFSVVGDANTTYYAITDGTNWEVGLGTYTSSGTTLSRDTILESSNSGNAVNWGAGTKNIFVTYPAERSVTGPSSATDNALVRFDGTTGGIVQNSGVTVGDNGDLTFPAAIIETVFTITDGASVDINPSNGTIQLWTLGASRTPTATSFAAGESVTLMINDGTAYTVTWTTIGVVWVGGAAPTLATTGYTVIELWKVSTTVYGALVGSVA